LYHKAWWLAQEGWAGDWAQRAAFPRDRHRRSPLPRTTQGSVGYLPFNTPFHSPLALTGFLAPPHPHLHPQSPRAMRLTSLVSGCQGFVTAAPALAVAGHDALRRLL
jgi:hypothetical protein